jgi:hypothetical protein
LQNPHATFTFSKLGNLCIKSPVFKSTYDKDLDQ